MAYLTEITAAAALIAACAMPAYAQDSGETEGPPPAPITPPCQTDEHRAFDFWIGTWDVTPAGRDAPTATNKITLEHGGCMLREDYVTGQYTGGSMSFYDPRRKIWHQTWMGADGSPLYIEGGPDENGTMVLGSKDVDDGRPEGTYSRVTWAPNEDGSVVRQHWEATQDDGATWRTIFDGTYVRKAGGAMEEAAAE